MQTSFDENMGIFGLDGQDEANGCGRALGAWPPHPRTRPDTTPNRYPNGQNPDKTDVRLGSRGGVGLSARGGSGSRPVSSIDVQSCVRRCGPLVWLGSRLVSARGGADRAVLVSPPLFLCAVVRILTQICSQR